MKSFFTYLLVTGILSFALTGCKKEAATKTGLEHETANQKTKDVPTPPLRVSKPYVLLQADRATDVAAPMRLVDLNAGNPETGQPLTGAANNTYLEIPQGAGKPPEVNGSAELPFTIEKDDTYFLWARVYWDDGCGNSVGMSIDDGKEFLFGQDGTYRQWHWVNLKGRNSDLDLSSGEHTLTLTNREDGIAIDQILLTRNKRLVPVGTME